MVQIPGNELTSERRIKPRITCNFAAIVRGRDQNGREFEENARVVNLSASGACLRLKRFINSGEALSVRIALPTGSLKSGTSKLDTDGIVMRGESLQTGLYQVAFKFNHHHFR